MVHSILQCTAAWQESTDLMCSLTAGDNGDMMMHQRCHDKDTIQRPTKQIHPHCHGSKTTVCLRLCSLASCIHSVDTMLAYYMIIRSQSQQIKTGQDSIPAYTPRSNSDSNVMVLVDGAESARPRRQHQPNLCLGLGGSAPKYGLDLDHAAVMQTIVDGMCTLHIGQKNAHAISKLQGKQAQNKCQCA